jgi:hypothetical protein
MNAMARKPPDGIRLRRDALCTSTGSTVDRRPLGQNGWSSFSVPLPGTKLNANGSAVCVSA